MKNNNYREHGHLLIALLVSVIFIFTLYPSVFAVPQGPVLTYISNTTAATQTANRSDAKGQIITVSMTLNQQDQKWKAYVGNVTGSLVLDNSNALSIYDWALSSIAGEVYATRSSSVSWGNVYCANGTVVSTEGAALGMADTAVDSINRTFNYTTHRSFVVGSINITNSTCKSTATYINDSAQFINESTGRFQEILLKDNTTGSLIYTTLLEIDALSYNGASTFDFQMLVAENETGTSPLMYYFYVELG